MKKTTHLFLLALFAIAISCTPAAKNDENATSETEAEAATKDVTQLTYRDVVAIVFDDDGEGIEWHGEEMPNTLGDLLTIDSGDSCGENGCGTQLSLTSLAEKPMTVIIKGDYDIKGDQGYIPRKYIIEPAQTLSIGCSHLCYQGESYEFLRTVVGSAYTE